MQSSQKCRSVAIFQSSADVPGWMRCETETAIQHSAINPQPLCGGFAAKCALTCPGGCHLWPRRAHQATCYAAVSCLCREGIRWMMNGPLFVWPVWRLCFSFAEDTGPKLMTPLPCWVSRDLRAPHTGDCWKCQGPLSRTKSWEDCPNLLSWVCRKIGYPQIQQLIICHMLPYEMAIFRKTHFSGKVDERGA